MSVTDIRNIKEEVVVFMRNGITDPNARGTTGSDVFAGDGATTTFTLANKDVKNVISVTEAGTAKAFGTDYSVDYKNTDPTAYPTVTFTSAPASGAEVIVNNHWGETWVYSDYPRLDLSLSSYPRVSVDVTSARTDPFGIGGTAVISDYMLTLTAFAQSTETVDHLLNQARSGLIANMTGFYNFNNILPTALGPMGKEPGRHDKIQIRNLDFAVRLKIDQK